MAVWLKQGRSVEASKADEARVRATVETMLAAIESEGMAAVRRYSRELDNWDRADFRLGKDEIRAAYAALPESTIDDIRFAQTQIRNFAQIQRDALHDVEVETLPGVVLGHKNIPVNAVGVYVPGGKYPMVASAHMGVVTAKVAGVKHIISAAPPYEGRPNPAIVVAQDLAGADTIIALGGVQAIGLMAFGNAASGLPAVDMLVGPGNAYVAEAKRQVFGHVGIDSIAGPSEVVVLADKANDPRLVAVDLLAQAEHDEAAQSILITDSEAFARAVIAAVEAELSNLPRRDIAGASWGAHGAVIQVRNWDEAIELVNRLAPEHLQIMLPDPAAIFARIRHAGAAFLGAFCPEALGDYIAGPNHVLPTGRTARFASGLSVFDFLKRTTWIQTGREGLAEVGAAAVALAEAEGLQAHGRSIALRLGPAR